MGKIITFIVGIFLIIWAFIPIENHPATLGYQIPCVSAGILLVIFGIYVHKKGE